MVYKLVLIHINKKKKHLLIHVLAFYTILLVVIYFNGGLETTL